MGMTIDEAIEVISDIDKAYRTFSNIEYKALQRAIDAMRKYRKIEDIYYHQTGFALENSLREVIENGNVD